jgi:DNA-binding NarL/FixJ family response regulator
MLRSTGPHIRRPAVANWPDWLRESGHVPAQKDSGVQWRRQLEVLARLADRLGNAWIGERLVVSEKTVDPRRVAILRKLGVPYRAEAPPQAPRLALVWSAAGTRAPIGDR